MINADEAARENEREERDLVAQEVTAIWTRITAAAAIVGAATGIVGLGLIWVAYRESYKANVNTFHADRPWLDFTLKDIKQFNVTGTPANGEAIFAISEIQVVNIGKTVAYDAHCRMRAYIGHSIAETDVKSDIMASSFIKTGRAVFPGGIYPMENEIQSTVITKAPAPSGESITTRETLWIVVAIVYKDNRGIQHSTGYIYFVEADDVRGDPARIRGLIPWTVGEPHIWHD